MEEDLTYRSERAMAAAIAGAGITGIDAEHAVIVYTGDPDARDLIRRAVTEMGRGIVIIVGGTEGFCCTSEGQIANMENNQLEKAIIPIKLNSFARELSDELLIKSKMSFERKARPVFYKKHFSKKK